MKRNEESVYGSYEDQHMEKFEEEMLEKLFWEFDRESKLTGETRLTFKGKMRWFARFCKAERK